MEPVPAVDHGTVLEAIRAGLRPGNARLSLRRAVEDLRRHVAHFHWVGIYLLEREMLVLEAYSGAQETEHTRIPLGQGICGAAARERRTIVVPDVHADARYLACFPSTRSEIVVPILRDGAVLGELDVDSDRPAAFDERDRALLEDVAQLLARLL